MDLALLQSHLRDYLGPDFVLSAPSDELALAVWNHACRSFRELLDAKLCAFYLDIGSDALSRMSEAQYAIALVIQDCQ